MVTAAAARRLPLFQQAAGKRLGPKPKAPQALRLPGWALDPITQPRSRGTGNLDVTRPAA